MLISLKILLLASILSLGVDALPDGKTKPLVCLKDGIETPCYLSQKQLENGHTAACMAVYSNDLEVLRADCWFAPEGLLRMCPEACEVPQDIIVARNGPVFCCCHGEKCNFPENVIYPESSDSESAEIEMEY